MTVIYNGADQYTLDFDFHSVDLNHSDIQDIANWVGEHIEKEFESKFNLPTSDKLIKDNEILEEQLEQAEGSLEELKTICDNFVAEVDNLGD